MDLSTFGTAATAEQGAVMIVCNPQTGAELHTADGQPITITLASDDSERVRKVTRAATNRRLAASRGGRNTVTAEALEADALNALIAGTIAWSGIVIAGETLPLSDANARRAFTELPWLREQTDQFMGERGNFSPKSPTS